MQLELLGDLLDPRGEGRIGAAALSDYLDVLALFGAAKEINLLLREALGGAMDVQV